MTKDLLGVTVMLNTKHFWEIRYGCLSGHCAIQSQFVLRYACVDVGMERSVSD